MDLIYEELKKEYLNETPKMQLQKIAMEKYNLSLEQSRDLVNSIVQEQYNKEVLETKQKLEEKSKGQVHKIYEFSFIKYFIYNLIYKIVLFIILILIARQKYNLIISLSSIFGCILLFYLSIISFAKSKTYKVTINYDEIILQHKSINFIKLFFGTSYSNNKSELDSLEVLGKTKIYNIKKIERIYNGLFSIYINGLIKYKTSIYKECYPLKESKCKEINSLKIYKYLKHNRDLFNELKKRLNTK